MIHRRVAECAETKNGEKRVKTESKMAMLKEHFA
jgi:hypothetical protein